MQTVVFQAYAAWLSKSSVCSPETSEVGQAQTSSAVAERILSIVERHGPRAVAMYVGTNALPYPAAPLLAVPWMRALGSRMFFTSNTIDQPGKQIATAAGGPERWRRSVHT